MSDSIQKGYTTIKELPSEVRSSFDERDQEKWMEAYNQASESKDPEEAKVDAWMSMVDAPSSLAVETWGSVEVRDADGELVPVKTIEEYADKFIENGGLMHDSHSNVPVGTVWDYEVRKHPETGQDGIVFYFNIYRDGEVFERARDDILSGRKNAVSIGAEAPRGGYKCDDRGCYVERDVTDLYELSICETPANPEAYFINVGKDIAKAKTPIDGEVFRIGIKDITVHQDYTTCPLQKCKHDLLEKGFQDIHITDDGKVIAKSEKNEFELLKTIQKMDYTFRYDLKKEQFEIMIDYDVEHAIEEAVENGWAHEDNIGHVCLTKEIPKEVFIDWYDRGFIVKIGDNYCLKGDDVAKEDVKKFVADDVPNKIVVRDKANEEITMEFFKMKSDNYHTSTAIYFEENPINPYNPDIELKIEIRNAIDDIVYYGTWQIQRYDRNEEMIDILNGENFAYSIKDVISAFKEFISEIVVYPDGKFTESTKKKVKKDGGAMGVGDAGATNPVYGAKPTSLVTPTGDKKYGKKKKTKKEMTDDGNVHGPKAKIPKMKKSLPLLGNTVAEVELDDWGWEEITARGQLDGKQYYGLAVGDFDVEFELAEEGDEVKCTVHMIDESGYGQWIDERTFRPDDEDGIIEFMKDYTVACWNTYSDGQ